MHIKASTLHRLLLNNIKNKKSTIFATLYNEDDSYGYVALFLTYVV